VITDGADSNFYFKDLDRDLKKDAKETIARVLNRAFARASKKDEGEGDPTGSDVRLHVIGFEVSAAEKKERGYKDFLPAVKKVKGVYHDAANPEKLALFLRQSLLHLYFWVDPEAGLDEVVTDVRTQGNSISRIDRRIDLRQNLRWVALKTGDHRVYIPALRSPRQRILIDPGDSLLLEADQGRGGLAFCRSVYAEMYQQSKRGYARLSTERPGGWVLAALENKQTRGDDKLQVLLTLERQQRRPAGRNEQIGVVRPRWAWFETPAPKGEDFSPRLHVFSQANYPAPAWDLRLPFWPLQKKEPGDGAPASTVRAWWIEKDRPLPVAASLVKPAFPSALKLVNRPWPTEKKEHQVSLESVRLEKVLVEVRPGTYRPQGCLVVRLLYPPPTPDGKRGPFFVRLPGWEYEGKAWQHRFYHKVGKSTSIFWPFEREEADKLSQLDLISVEECKARALTVPPLELGEPDERSRSRP
jgi:hypothetical protein